MANKRNKTALIYSPDTSPDAIISQFIKSSSMLSQSRELFNTPSTIRKNPTTPIFIYPCCSQHEIDFYNITQMRRQNNLLKEDISIVIFDLHTDMYWHISKNNLTKKRINMANWVGHLLETGYSGINVVGVEDFTRSCKEMKGKEYHTVKDRIKFFTGQRYFKSRDFWQHKEEDFTLHKEKEFLETKLRTHTYVSIDGDVSEELTGPAEGYNYLGAMKIDNLKTYLKYIHSNSKVIGTSFFGVTYSPFTNPEKSSKLIELLNIK